MERIVTETTHYKLKKLSGMVEKGELRLPNFQRKYVWNLDKAAYLWDSIVKGIPINSIILWYSEIKLNAIKTFGDIELLEPKNKVYYALDGQQRVTTIFGTFKGLVIENVDFKELYLDISLDPNEYTTFPQVISQNKIKRGTEDNYYNLHDAIKGKLNHADTVEKYGRDRFDNLLEYIDIIKSAEIPISIANGNNPSVSAEIFTRTNTSGKDLSPYEIMSAIIFDNDSEFYFNSRIENLKEDMKGLNFNFSNHDLFRAVSVILYGGTDKATLLSLNKDMVIDNWDEVHISMLSAIDFLKLHFKIYSKKELISNSHFYLISRFFFYNKGKNPTYKQLKLLEEYILMSGLSDYFSKRTPVKLAKDAKRISKILENERLPYTDFNTPKTLQEFIELGKLNKSKSSAYNKTILSILRMKNPKSYSNGMSIIGDNMSSANGVHLHHIFPKAVYGSRADNIFNISILDSETNQNISVKNPNNYMVAYSKEPNFNEIISSHFIDNLKDFGILDTNLDLLIEKRAGSILNWIESRIGYNILTNK